MERIRASPHVIERLNKYQRLSQTSIDIMSGKTSWPEVVGMENEKAVEYIKKGFNGSVGVITDDMIYSSDLQNNRVRVHVKDGKIGLKDGRFHVTGGIVDRVPHVG